MKALFPFLILSFVVFSSCQMNHDYSAEAAENEFRTDLTNKSAPAEGLAIEAQGNQSHELLSQRDLIRTAYVELESENLNLDKKTILEMCSEHRGFVHSENSNFTEKSNKIVLGISVAKDQFDSFMSSLDQRFPDRSSTQISTVDVTDQLVDLTARIKSKRILEERLFQLIEKTNDMSDVLSLEQSLNKVRQEIEQMQAQTLSLRNQVAVSKINITITQPYIEQVAALPTFGDKASSQFESGWSGIKSLCLVFIGLWPLLLAGITAAFLFKSFKNRLFGRKIKA